MDKYLTKNQIKVILDNAPKEVDRESLLRKFDSSGYVIQGYNDEAKIAEEQRIQQEGTKAKEFLGKSPLQQIFSKETAKELLPSAGSVAKDVFIDTPIKTIKSAITAPTTIATGGQYTAPGTYQAEAKQTAEDIIEGKKPLVSALTPFLTVPLDVTGTVGLGVGASSLVKQTAKKVAPMVTEQLAKRQATRIANETANADKIVGQIIQGTPEDIATAKNALSQIDTKDIKTYTDLGDALDTRIKVVSNKLDETLEQTPVRNELLRLGDMEKAITVGNQTVRQNYVEDALDQLRDFYTKTNNIEKRTAIEQLIRKGDTEGLSVKELNDIAKLHGQDLSGFNASGQLASGLSKQAAENTRTGVKSTAREIYGGEAYAQADKELTNLIRTRDLVKDVDKKVNQLKQRVTERGFGEEAGRLIFQIADKFTGGGLKGFIQSFIPRGQGLKVMNALDLEKALEKNLRAVDSALNQKTEKGAINELQKIIQSYKNTPNKQGGFVAVPNQASEAFLKSQPKTNINSNTLNIPKSSPKATTKSSLKGKGVTPETNLINQAKKYKSAEEFVKAQQPTNLTTQQQGMMDASLRVAREQNIPLTKDGNLVLYHGTQEARMPKVGDEWRTGSYFTSSESTARQFAGQGGNGKVVVMKVEVPPYKVFNSGDGTYFNSNEPFVVKSVDTKSQLEEIWKKANNKK